MNIDADYLLATISALHFTIAQLRAQIAELTKKANKDESQAPKRAARRTTSNPPPDGE